MQYHEVAMRITIDLDPGVEAEQQLP